MAVDERLVVQSEASAGLLERVEPELDVVVRDGQFVRLAGDAVTDLARFEELADQALSRDATPEAASRRLK